MSAIEIKDENIDGQNRLIGYRIHDAGFVGMEWDNEHSLVIKLRRIDGRLLLIRLEDLPAVGFRKFRNGAILFEACAWPRGTVLPDAANDENGFWSVLFGNDLSSPHLDAAINAHEQKEDFEYMFFLDCSTYGGYLAALCRRISFEVL